jgi:hypothetical protein
VGSCFKTSANRIGVVVVEGTGADCGWDGAMVMGREVRDVDGRRCVSNVQMAI